MPSHKKKTIEKAKFTYSPLRKAFEKQIKTIKDQGKKQINSLKTLKAKELEAIKDIKSDDNEKLWKDNKIFEDLSNKRIDDIQNMIK